MSKLSLLDCLNNVVCRLGVNIMWFHAWWCKIDNTTTKRPNDVMDIIKLSGARVYLVANQVGY